MINRQVLILLLSGIVILSSNIWGYSIYILDESKNAECAREMLERGDMIVPTFNYQPRTDKPPLHYYFMMLSYLVFGVNEFAARFFSVVFGLLTLLSTYYFTNIHLGKRAALFSSISLLSSLGFILQFHLAVPDPYLVFFTTFSILAFFHGIKTHQTSWLYLSYGSLGLSVLSKGPVGLVLVFIPVFLFLLLNRKVRKVNRFPIKLLPGLFIIGAISLPWFWLVNTKTSGEWLGSFVFEHNIQRFLTPKEGHGGNFLLTPLFLLIMSLPLGVFVFPALKKAWKRTYGLSFLSFLVIASVLTVFSISATKLPNYVSPALPFISIIIGGYLSELGKTTAVLKISTVIYAALTFLGVSLIMPESGLLPIENEYLLPFVLIPLGGTIACLMLWTNRLIASIFTLAASFALTITIMFYLTIPELDRINPVQKIINEINDQEHLSSFHIFNPSFSFYLQRPIHVFNDYASLESFLQDREEAIVISRQHTLKELRPLGLDTLIISKDLFESTSTAVMKTKKK